MPLRSYSYMPKEIDISFFYEINEEINNLRGYFYKFAGTNADEAIQLTMEHVLRHYDAHKGGLNAYIKKLAREITKDSGKVVAVDFLEQTVVDNGEGAGVASDKIDVGRVEDFSTVVLDRLERQEDRLPEVINLSLEFMGYFVTLCEALMTCDLKSSYYPDKFKEACLKLSRKCANFNKLCIMLYSRYRDKYKWFLALEAEDEDWKEPDFALCRSCKSRRIKLVDPQTGVEVEDADRESYAVLGSLEDGSGSKKILRIRYYEMWSFMCDLIDDDSINEMKFVIGNSYIVRTFGGSWSHLNVSLYTMYESVRTEILTNVLRDIGGKVLNIGSENFYIVCNKSVEKTGITRVVHGCTLSLVYEDITGMVI